MPHEPPEASLDHNLSRTSVPAPKTIQMKPFKRSHTGPKRLNALGMAGALDDSGTPDVSADSDNEYSLVDEDGTRAQRFATDLQGNRFRELEARRVEERKAAIKAGLISDPDKPTSLEHAIEFRGTCKDMCPLFEQQEREFKKNVHPLEQREGQPGRIDPAKAVTMYHRSAAGIDQPLPSDVRDPETLKRTLDHLFHHVLDTPAPPPTDPDQPVLPAPLASLKHTHHFLRDRTRGIRQDFTYQRQWGVLENIECHERIARFHILSIYMLGTLEERHFLKQEAEQLNKTLISLIELYEDQRLDGHDSQNEPEFRAYQLLSHLHDQEVARSILALPAHIFNHPLVQIVFDLRALAQRNFDTQKVGSKSNAEISLNFFTRYFKRIKSPDVPFLVACLAHNKLGEVRRAGVRALMRSYARVQPANIGTSGMKTKVMTIEVFREMMGCVDDDEALDLAVTLDVTPVWEDGRIEGEGMPMGFLISAGAEYNDNADAPPSEKWPDIEAKRSGASFQEIIDGKVSTTSSKSLRPAFTPTESLQQQAKVQVQARPAWSSKQSAFSGQSWSAGNAPEPQPHVGVGAAPPRQPLVMEPPSRPSSATETRGAFGQTAPSLPASTSFSASQPFARPGMQKAEPEQVVRFSQPEIQERPVIPALVGPPPARPDVISDHPPVNAIASSSTPKKLKRVVAEKPKGPSPEQMEVIARNIASRLLFEVVNQQKEAIITEAVKHEKKRRAAELRDKENKRVYGISQGLTERTLEVCLQYTCGRIAAQAYLEECRRLTSLHVSFGNWFSKASSKRRRREIKETKRQRFAARIQGMGLGASQAGGTDLDGQLDETISKSVRRRGTSSLGLDLAYHGAEDTVAVMDHRTKQKAILEEGTFFSLVGNHVCNIESELDALEARKADVQDLGEWHVVVDTTDGTSGEWLRRKFNLTEGGRYEANFSGSCRDAKIVAVANSHDEEDWAADVGLVVFECHAELSRNQQRYRDIVAKIPPRRRFQLGILFVTWVEADCEDLFGSLGLHDKQPAFAWHHVICLKKDASDRAFDRSLFDALPEVTTVPTKTFSTSGVLEAMVPHWKGLRAVAVSLLDQEELDLGLLARIVRLLLQSLTELQQRIVHDFLLPLDVTTDGFPIVEFAVAPCPDGLEFPSQLRSAILTAVPNGDDIPEIIAEALNEWKETEDLEDRPIGSALHFVDLQAEAIQRHVCELDICIPETEIADADRIGEDAVVRYQDDVEAIRGEITRLATPPQPKPRLSVLLQSVTPSVEAVAPHLSAAERLQAAIAAAKPEIDAAEPLTKEHMTSAILQHTYAYHAPTSNGKRRLATPDDDKRAKLRRLTAAAAKVAITPV